MKKIMIRFLACFIPNSNSRRKFRHRFLSKRFSEAESLAKNSVDASNSASRYGFKDCYIFISTEIYGCENLSMGRNCWIGGNCLIAAGNAKIKFGHNVIIAGRCVLLNNSHNYRSDKCLPYDRGNISRPIEIEDCVWIGMQAIIMGGVKIEKGAIVGAGAVVTKSVPKCAIVAGNPAKIIGWRDEKVFDKLYNMGRFEELSKIDKDEYYEIVENKFKKFLKPGE